jgi:citronellol/citronellal dehydrogenase
VAAIDASRLLRPGLLEGSGVLVAAEAGSREGDGSLAAAVCSACAGAGARVARCAPVAGAPEEDQEGAMDDAVRLAVAEVGSVEMLVVDAAGLFAGPSPGRAAREALVACLDGTWSVTRSVFNLALLPAGRGGRIVFLAPPPSAGEHAEPARAGLENLSRTLSVEWSRHGVTPVTIAPGESTPASEVAALTAYLASPAGAYFSGCLLDLRGVAD